MLTTTWYLRWSFFFFFVYLVRSSGCFSACLFFVGTCSFLSRRQNRRFYPRKQRPTISIFTSMFIWIRSGKSFFWWSSGIMHANAERFPHAKLSDATRMAKKSENTDLKRDVKNNYCWLFNVESIVVGCWMGGFYEYDEKSMQALWSIWRSLAQSHDAHMSENTHMAIEYVNAFIFAAFIFIFFSLKLVEINAFVRCREQ